MRLVDLIPGIGNVSPMWISVFACAGKGTVSEWILATKSNMMAPAAGAVTPRACSISTGPACICTKESYPLSRIYLRPLLFLRHLGEVVWFAMARLFGRGDRLTIRVKMLKGAFHGYN